MTTRATNTTLAFGLVKCDVGLYKTTGEPEKLPKWVQAGPNGGELTDPGVDFSETAPAAGSQANPVAVKADPLAEDPAEAFAQITQTTEDPEEPYFIEAGTGEQVAKSETRLGVRDEDGTFHDLTEPLAEIDEYTKLEEMRITDFIRTEEVRRERITGSYYLAPRGPEAAHVLSLLCASMRTTRRVAVVKFTKRSRQSLGVIIPHPAMAALEVIEMAWAEDVRQVPEQCVLEAAAAEEVDVACDLVTAMSSSRSESLDEQTDDRRRLVAALLQSVQDGSTFALAARPETEDGADVIDLMARGLKNRDELAAAAA